MTLHKEVQNVVAATYPEWSVARRGRLVAATLFLMVSVGCGHEHAVDGRIEALMDAQVELTRQVYEVRDDFEAHKTIGTTD